MLIQNIDILKEALGGIQQTMNWRTWRPFVQQAEMLYIVPAIGQELYDELDENTNPDELTGTLLTWLRMAIAEYADLLGGMRLVLHTSDAGKQSPSGTNMQAPGKWMIVAARKEAINKADLALENALRYLETNKSAFLTWRNSSSYTLSKGSFINSATELTEFFPAARSSRRIYLALRDYLAKAEKFYVKPLIGAATYTNWKTRLAVSTPNWTPEETEALELLRFALVHRAFSESITFLNINEDWRLLSETDGITNEEVLPVARRAEMRQDCEFQQQEFQARLVNYLTDHASATIFPDYFGSTLYQPTRRRSGSRITNDPTKSYYGF